MSPATTALPPFASAAASAATRLTALLPASRTSIAATRIVATCDVGVVMTTLLLVLAARTGDQWPEGFSDFLALRITVRDIGLLMGFAALVLIVFETLGAYEAARVRRWSDEMGRVFVSTTALAALAALFVTTSGTGGPRPVGAAAILGGKLRGRGRGPDGAGQGRAIGLTMPAGAYRRVRAARAAHLP